VVADALRRPLSDLVGLDLTLAIHEVLMPSLETTAERIRTSSPAASRGLHRARRPRGGRRRQADLIGLKTGMVNGSVRCALLFSLAEQHLRFRRAERRLAMATARRTPAVTPDEGLAERAPRRRRTVPPAAEQPTDRSQWTVTSGDTVTDVASRAGAWSAATGAYTRGQAVIVRSTP
jgi:hypothetical protein